jgi:hypothetical protein
VIVALPAPQLPTPPVPPSIPFDPNMGPPESVVQIVFIVFGTMAVMGLGIAMFRALGKYFERRQVPASTSPEVLARLERIEQAVESIAIEVERISEGQRFTTKLMSELRGLPQPDAMAQRDVASLQRAPQERVR